MFCRQGKAGVTVRTRSALQPGRSWLVTAACVPLLPLVLVGNLSSILCSVNKWIKINLCSCPFFIFIICLYYYFTLYITWAEICMQHRAGHLCWEGICSNNLCYSFIYSSGKVMHGIPRRPPCWRGKIQYLLCCSIYCCAFLRFHSSRTCFSWHRGPPRRLQLMGSPWAVAINLSDYGQDLCATATNMRSSQTALPPQLLFTLAPWGSARERSFSVMQY